MIRILSTSLAAIVSNLTLSAMPAMSQPPSDDSALVSQAADLPLPLTSFGAARLGDKVYVYGGHTGEAHSYSIDEQSGKLYSLDLNQPGKAWEELSESTRLQGLAMVAFDGKLIRVGGFSAMNQAGEEDELRSTDEVMGYAVASGEWSPLPPLPEPRSSHDAILLGASIYVVGGWQLSGDAAEAKWHETAYKLDLSQQTPKWEPIAGPPAKLRGISLAALGDEILLIGGMAPEGKITAGTSLYNPSTDSWREGPQLAGEGRMFGFGTAALTLPGRTVVSNVDGTLQQLGIGSEKWEIIGRTPDARIFHKILPVDEEAAIVIGGTSMEVGKFRSVNIVALPE